MTDIQTSHSLTSLIQLASASVTDYKMLDKSWAVRVTDPKTCNSDEITGLNYFSSAAVKEIERYKFALCSVGFGQDDIEEGIAFYHSQPGTWKEKLKAFLAVKRVALNKPRQPLHFRRRANRAITETSHVE